MHTSRAAVARVAAIAGLLCGAAAAAEDSRPQRIVSLNLCTDQHLMRLVEPERIAAVSHLASDPASSALAEQARALPATYGVAEEVIALAPDLVLAGVYTTRMTTEILRRIGIPVVELAPEQSFEDIRRNIRAVGDAVGEPERAEGVIAAFDRELAAVAVEDGGGDRPVFTSYGANGFMSGAGTLEAEVARVAGYDVLGERLGVVGSAQTPLEVLLTSSVDVMNLTPPSAALPSLAEERQRHPALRRYLRERTVVDIPSALLSCGTPATLEAVRLLASARPGEGD